MRVTVQRVQSASCTVDNKLISQTNFGYMLLIGFTHNDTLDNVEKMCKKIANLRVFDDENGKMNKSIIDVNGQILAISQFTLYADATHGNRPSFVDAMEPAKANDLYQKMITILNDEYHIKTLGGSFGAHMILHPVCDGPVTINLEL